MLLFLELRAQLIGADGRDPLVLAQADIFLPVAERSRSVGPSTRDVVYALTTA